jgi:ribosomal protein S18 acetylase RimI-like enzyme
MEITLATPEDAEAILAVQKAAFAPVAEEYRQATLLPLEETLDDLLGLFRDHTILKAVEDGRVVGSVRGVMRRGTCEIGRLVVDPASQGRGIGRALASEIESRFPDAVLFELFTGHHGGAALHIYGKLGYGAFRVERVDDDLTFVHLRKPGHAAR